MRARDDIILFIREPVEPIRFVRKEVALIERNLSLTFTERAVTVGSRDFDSPVRISGHSYATAQVFEFEGDAGDGYIQKSTLFPTGEPHTGDNP